MIAEHQHPRVEQDLERAVPLQLPPVPRNQPSTSPARCHCTTTTTTRSTSHRKSNTKRSLLTRVCVALIDCLWQITVVLYDMWLFEVGLPSIVIFLDHVIMVLGIISDDGLEFTKIRYYILCDRAIWYFAHALFSGFYQLNMASVFSVSILTFEVTRFMFDNLQIRKKISFNSILLSVLVYDAASYTVMACVEAKAHIYHPFDRYVYEHYIPIAASQFAVVFITSAIAGTIYGNGTILPR